MRVQLERIQLRKLRLHQGGSEDERVAYEELPVFGRQKVKVAQKVDLGAAIGAGDFPKKQKVLHRCLWQHRKTSGGNQELALDLDLHESNKELHQKKHQRKNTKV